VNPSPSGARESLRNCYREAARRSDWLNCRLAAEQLCRLRKSPSEGSEDLYALGYAYERLGNAASARVNYEAALTLDNGHGKARRRLLALDTTA
jgi:Flp pilus assembly protein TadD